MSKAIDLFTIRETVINPDDKQDFKALGTFLIALGAADLDKLGVSGPAVIQAYGGDYCLRFLNGRRLVRAGNGHNALVRQGVCPMESCGATTCSDSKDEQYCTKCWAELHCEDGREVA